MIRNTTETAAIIGNSEMSAHFALVPGRGRTL